jgi:diphthine-ammonia ligase
MRAVSMWSGGKDSCFALYKAISKGIDVCCLLNFITKEGSSISQGVDSKVVLAQSKALGIPMVQIRANWGSRVKYEQDFKRALCEQKRRGVEAAVFGDIYDFPDHEGWNERVCREVGIKTITPLWRKDPKQLITDFVKEGFEAVVVKTKADLLNKEWIGRKIDEAFIKDLVTLNEKVKIDFCGELGEYHTLVCDGPIFKKRLEILDFSKKSNEGYWLIDIKDFRIAEK